ncbi:DgyrCDS12231 [Dimorphilus gyrociliatus]|uniref:DgyrCDS12231 n=1 Tax=Dimorphilus gyrociliatus TaxID=2664684 RepID=A0A7I8W7L8_9ANNE|nr:DgyrCDS12231 [Dimorphilus gyrociliatus]
MMELNLSRLDYLQTGTTSPNSMQLLPATGKKEQTNKVAVADHSGVVQCFGIKKKELQSVFKTLPSQVKLTRMELGGPPGGIRDRIFVCAHSEIRGFSKKGKQFLTFETNLTDPIKAVYVEGGELLVGSNYIYNRYTDCTDSAYYLCPDRISDVLCLPPDKTDGLLSVVACEDKMLRMIQDSEMIYEFEIGGSPSTTKLYEGTGGEEGDEVIYGTRDGKLGLAQLSRLLPSQKWEVSNDKQHGGILSLDHYDIYADGIQELIVSRDDGMIEIYGYDENDEPILRHHQTFAESVTSIRGGVVSAPGYDELVCTTYSGWVSSLTTEPESSSKIKTSMPSTPVSSHSSAEPVKAEQYVGINHDTLERIVRIKDEIEELQNKVAVERERYQSMAAQGNSISAVPHFQVNNKWRLSRADASYILSIEVHTAIDFILLQSDVPVDLLDVDRNQAVVSYSATSVEDGNYLLTTYRCQANATRIEIKVRSIEGQYGRLTAYIAPRLHPKVCCVNEFPIKPLSLHERTHKWDDTRPSNSLSLRGQFSLAEVHSWIAFCLPDVPDRAPPGEKITMTFASTFLNTQLECCYSAGEAVFTSDSVSTISILKDVLSKEATNKKIRLDMSYDISDSSVPHVLELIHPLLEEQLTLAKNVQLIDALKDLQVHETDVSFLSDDYKGILENADELKEKYQRQPCYLQRLYGIITDLFIDKYKFKGQNSKNKVPALMEVLDNYSLESLIAFFSRN